MLYAIIAYDKPGHLPLRQETRPSHVAYLKGSPVLIQAGPFLDDNGDMCGSLLIVDVADMDAARAWAAEDPYAKAGLFATSKIMAWNKVI